jgi:hypothetical protein
VLPGLRSIRSRCKPALSVSARSHPEASPERPAERLLTIEAAGERHIQHRILARQKQKRGTLQPPQPQRVLFRRFARHRGEDPM